MSGFCAVSVDTNILGLPENLCNILKNLDTTNLEPPTWNLSNKPGFGISLSLIWRQNCHTTKAPIKSKSPTPATSSLEVNKGSGTTPQPKRKSPSTRRRNRKRLIAWKAKKRAQIAKNTQSSPTEATPTPTLNVSPEPKTSDATGHVEAVIATEETVSKSVSKVPSVIPLDHPLDAREVDPPAEKSPDRIQILETNATNSVDSDSNLDCLDDERFTDQLQELSQSLFPVINHCFNFECMIAETEVSGGLKKCTRCNLALYCSRECQTKHWRLHKAGCKPGVSGN